MPVESAAGVSVTRCYIVSVLLRERYILQITETHRCTSVGAVAAELRRMMMSICLDSCDSFMLGSLFEREMHRQVFR